MNRARFSIEEVALKVDKYGYADCIMEIVDANDIEDVRLKELWQKAEEVITSIYEILEPYSDEINNYDGDDDFDFDEDYD